MAQYRKVLVGGAFDYIHRGHHTLLSKAFEVGDFVLIGLVSDEFASRVEGKQLTHSYEERLSRLNKYIQQHFPNRRYVVSKLEDYFGPEAYGEDVEAIVVSEETARRVDMVNRERVRRGVKPLKAVVVGMVMAEDGRPISTTRIRRGEIDEEGRVVKP